MFTLATTVCCTASHPSSPRHSLNNCCWLSTLPGKHMLQTSSAGTEVCYWNLLYCESHQLNYFWRSMVLGSYWAIFTMYCTKKEVSWKKWSSQLRFLESVYVDVCLVWVGLALAGLGFSHPIPRWWTNCTTASHEIRWAWVFTCRSCHLERTAQQHQSAQ